MKKPKSKPVAKAKSKPTRASIETQIIAPATPYVLKHRTRFVTAAALFDGHDASINIMRRLLMNSGAEVVHLGHNRSAEEIVAAALQEDAQGIAVSSYQGGHNEFFRYMIDLLKKNNAGHIGVYGGGGGTITLSEIRELEKYGVKQLFSPADGRQLGLQGIINEILKSAEADPLAHIPPEALADVSFKDKRSVAYALTCLEQGEEAFTKQKGRSAFKKYVAKIQQLKSKATVIGITGTGGAGKSSLTDELLVRLLQKDPQAQIAVLAIDPTRKKTGGALLGDRLRMNSLKNPRCYMRSLATRDANSSISRVTKEAIQALRAAGFDWIFVETSGIGQADIPIVDLVDVNLYVMTSEFGAPTQLEKINMLDYAHIVAINKFDKVGSLDALTDVRKQFRRNHLEFEKLKVDQYPIFGTMASKFGDAGVNALFEHLWAVAKSGQKATKPVPSTVGYTPESSVALVPKERSQYLSEIAEGVRSYKKKALAVAENVGELKILEKLISKESFNETTRRELAAEIAHKNKAIGQEVIHEIRAFDQLAEKYHGTEFTYQVRGKDISIPLSRESLSQSPIRRVSPPAFLGEADKVKFVLLENLPGYFPFTAGVFPFKRSEEDPKRQFAGEGTPTRTNKRFHLLCEGEKAKRLSTAFDSVTLYGNDPDERPDIYGKIGESGVSVCTLDDAKKLYAGFDLCDPNTSVSMTINGPAPMLLAFFFNAAIDQQVEKFKKETGKTPTPAQFEKIKTATLSQVRGTVQADILKEDQAQNTCIFSTEFALKMMGDIQSYFVEHEIRNYYSVSISGYHIAEAGANPISQLAFTLANGFTYVEYYLARGMNVDDFAPNFSFFFSNALDPEYAVIGRVARRIWAIAMKKRYGANERSQKLKYHIQTSGRSLHAQEISFNDIRTTLQALIAYFDNCNSLHTNAYDEAVTTPTEESVRRAMAIQLIISKEFGWAKNENPLQGSFFIEELTELVEEAVLAEFDRISVRGGVLGAMETHYQRSKIQEESLQYETKKHSGELPLIGVNTFLNPQGPESLDMEASHLTRAKYSEKDEQIKNLRAFQKRNGVAAEKALKNLKDTAQRGSNVFVALMDAARVCSLGQMTRALYEIGGEYRRRV